jgi:tetratricopeptide (TPR) repeat protein
MNMRLATLILVFLTVSACVSTRKKGDASRFSKAYHNVTGKYNGFFNANILLQESIDKLNAQHRDNYNKLLDVYPYLAVDNPKAVSPDLDKAIEKVAVVATVHRVGHWTDDSYLLLGRAQFLKQDFESAEETFGFLTEEYNPSNIKAKDPKERKKMVAESKKAKEADAKNAAKDKKAALKVKEREREERLKLRKQEAEQRAKDRKSKVKTLKTDKSAPSTETVKETKVKKTTENGTPVITNADKKKRKINPDNYLFRHRPSYQEGMLWMARTLMERQKYDDAQFILEDLDKNVKTFRDVRGQLALAFAHLYLKQHLYEEAIPHLNEALQSKLGKKEKVRAAYILAQLHQRANRNEQAFTAFDKVLDYAPMYEMEFNARLNMALNGNTTNDVAVAGLNRMAKDFKNQEYLDQIYFALGQLSLKNGKKVEGIQYLEKALATGGSNPSVKAEAYYTLAKSYYESENYVKAKMYYDSTAIALDKSDTRKEEVKNYAENLTEIAQNISIIELKDSLLRISNMSPKEQRGLAARIKKNQDDAALAALMKLSAPETGAKTFDKRGTGDFATAGSDGGGYAAQSSFFAYNPESVRKGKREFEKRWGIERKLEDNWRRSNRRATSGATVADNSDAGSSTLSEKEVNAILKDVPRSQEEIESAKNQVADAMFQLGVLYHDKLKNYKKAIDILEKYNTRFPAGKEELTAWYYLYLSHMDLGEKAKAQSYYDKIQTKYADSNYAKVLRDPNALQNKDEQKVERYYDSTYVIFSKGQYKEAAEKIIAAEQLFGGIHPFKAKFALMNAMCLGNLKGKTEYINALREVVGRFGAQPEGKKASEILQILSNATTTLEPEKQPETTGSPFKNMDESPHFVMVLAEKTISLEDAKVGVSDYNSKYHRLDDLRLSSIFLDSDAEIAVLLVRKFSNKAAALAYTDGVSKNKADFLPINAKYQIFAIHQDNYREVIKQKSVVDYAKFYESNYKK